MWARDMAAAVGKGPIAACKRPLAAAADNRPRCYCGQRTNFFWQETLSCCCVGKRPFAAAVDKRPSWCGVV